MKRDASSNSGAAKTNPTPEPVTAAAVGGMNMTAWVKPEKRIEAPDPPPVWTRYIDSRLKQFCVR